MMEYSDRGQKMNFIYRPIEPVFLFDGEYAGYNIEFFASL